MSPVPAPGPSPGGALALADPTTLALAAGTALAPTPGPAAAPVDRRVAAESADTFRAGRDDPRQVDLARTLGTLRDAAARQQAAVAAQPAEVVATVAPSALVTVRAAEAVAPARTPVVAQASSQPHFERDLRISETQAPPSIDEPDPTPELTTAGAEHALGGARPQDAGLGLDS